jgi:hypothetical protein
MFSSVWLGYQSSNESSLLCEGKATGTREQQAVNQFAQLIDLLIDF